MSNKFRRVAAFALAMTVIAGSSNVFNVGVGGLPNLTSIVANAEDTNYNLGVNDGDPIGIDSPILKEGDTITVGNIDNATITNDNEEIYNLSINNNTPTTISLGRSVSLKKNCTYTVDNVVANADGSKTIYLTKKPIVLDENSSSVNVNILDKGDIIIVNHGTAAINVSGETNSVEIYINNNNEYNQSLKNGCIYTVTNKNSEANGSGGYDYTVDLIKHPRILDNGETIESSSLDKGDVIASRSEEMAIFITDNDLSYIEGNLYTLENNDTYIRYADDDTNLLKDHTVIIAEGDNTRIRNVTDIPLKVKIDGEAVTIPAYGEANCFKKGRIYVAYGNANELTSFPIIKNTAEINAPTITTQPSGFEVKKDSTSDNTLSVAATADDDCTLSYQWYSNTTNSNEGGTKITTNGTSENYTVPTDTVGKKYYYCRVTAKKGSQSKATTSNIAEVGVYRYKITLNSNYPNTTENVSNEVNVYENEDYLLPANTFTFNGYNFTGWNTLASPTESTPGTSYTKISSDNSEDITLYAQWRAIPAVAPTLNNNDIPTELEYKYEDTSRNISVSVNSPDTDNYEYSYQWYSNITNSNVGGTEINGATDSSYTIPTDAVGTKYYYCKVTATRKDNGETDSAYSACSKVNVYYEVSFDKGAADASGTTNAIKSYDGKVVLPANGFTRKCYSFDCWGYNGGICSAGIEKTVSNNVTFTALWKLNAPTVGVCNDMNLDYGYGAGRMLLVSVTDRDDDNFTYSYQWYSNTTKSTTGGNEINGATNSNYIIPTGNSAGEYYYYCVVTAKKNNTTDTAATTSDVITLNVNAANIAEENITAGLVFKGKQTPEVVEVMYGSTSLNTNDYDVEEVKDNSGNLCGVKITLKGNYSGSKTITFDYTPEKLATHSTNGNVAYWTYNDVNYIKENGKFKESDDLTIPSTSINSSIRVQTSRIEPTSEKDGYIITKIYCADCGKLISYKRVRIPKLS